MSLGETTRSMSISEEYVERLSEQQASASEQIDIDLADIDRFPLLARCLQTWRDSIVDGRLPAGLDTDRLPADVFPYTMLLDYQPARSDVYVRMVGSFIGERALFAAQGKTLRAFFEKPDADLIFDSLRSVAESKTPSVARRRHVPIAGEIVEYVRLILPLSLNGRDVTGFFKTIEPASLVEI